MYTYILLFAKQIVELDTAKIMLHIDMYFIMQCIAVYNKHTNLRTTTQNQQFGFGSQISKFVDWMLLKVNAKSNLSLNLMQ